MSQRILAELSPHHRIARARRDDVPAIVSLLAHDPLGAGREDPNDPVYAEAFEVIDQDPGQLLVVVLDTQDEVVGTLQLTFVPGLSRRGVMRAQIESVRVAESTRGSGLGTALFSWAIEHSRECGAGLVQLTTDKARPRAREFYERLGFVASHEGMKLAL